MSFTLTTILYIYWSILQYIIKLYSTLYKLSLPLNLIELRKIDNNWDW